MFMPFQVLGLYLRGLLTVAILGRWYWVAHAMVSAS